MRGFGGPRKIKKGGSKGMSIYSAIELDRKLGTYSKNNGPKNTILTSDWSRLKDDGKS
ncbi:MAG: hypothetical protein NE327_09205 [Lentisphaeraceae bacterium]|nr:hypothetical protein [Lentisphaeraceae bacterium]